MAPPEPLDPPELVVPLDELAPPLDELDPPPEPEDATPCEPPPPTFEFAIESPHAAATTRVASAMGNEDFTRKF